ncbi:MAG TPA: SEC-C metal-binding domain-containing protein, partial [Bryobacteraceae bacterium]|nr:SEC-C metal-binding domain-containing protein [Bryobacteraceae bacterium]
LCELTPEGVLENTFTSEIMGATWRLRRCRLLESTFDMIEDETPLEKQQKSVDRARAQSHSILRKSMTELRKLQTERQIRLQLEIDEPSGLADTRQILNAMKLHAAVCGSPGQDCGEEREEDAVEEIPDDGGQTLEALEELLRREMRPDDDSEVSPSSFCKPAARPPAAQAVSTRFPRNAPCRCGSGVKFKKCCGNPARPSLKEAA